MNSSEAFITSRKFLFGPKEGTTWASEMVLNPAIIEDPGTGRIHMLFRATGPWPQKQVKGQPLPFPIFLGYAWSDDHGKSWQVDFDRPALAPELAMTVEGMYINNTASTKVVNHANGCIEDPRLFFLDGVCHVIVACRMFPPGPYWERDEPTQCSPSWIATDKNPFGIAASQNVTVNVLFKVDLEALSRKQYGEAFAYVTHLTDPRKGENRDVILFPEKLEVNGRPQYVCLHRPWKPDLYPQVKGAVFPSIVACASHSLYDLWCEEQTQTLIAGPRFDWENDRIGASGPVVKLNDSEWLLSFHGKKDIDYGYSQSFMILETTNGALPRVKHRCSEPLMRAKEDWEMPGRFKTPVVFITGMIKLGDSLMVSYGAADQRVGIATFDLGSLVDHVRSFNSEGGKL